MLDGVGTRVLYFTGATTVRASSYVVHANLSGATAGLAPPLGCFVAPIHKSFSAAGFTRIRGPVDPVDLPSPVAFRTYIISFHLFLLVVLARASRCIFGD